MENFECRVPPMPSGSNLSLDVWEFTQTSKALKKWLTKHLGEGCGFTNIEMTNGVAIERCLEKQRETIRRRLLEDAGMAPVPSSSLDEETAEAASGGGVNDDAQDLRQPTRVDVNFPAYPVRRIPHGWRVRNVYCVNIPDDVMRYNATRWRDFDVKSGRGLAHKTLLYMLGRAIEISERPAAAQEGGGNDGDRRRGRGGRLGRNEPPDSESTDEVRRAQERSASRNVFPNVEGAAHLDGDYHFNYRPDGPDGPSYSLLKTTQMVEELLSVHGEHKGWRVFIFVHSDRIDLGKALTRVINESWHVRSRHLANARRKSSVEQCAEEMEKAKKKRVKTLCYMNVTTTTEFMGSVVMPYVHQYDRRKAGDLRRNWSREERSVRIDSPDAPLHPRNFIDLESALAFSKTYGVRDRQTEIHRYKVPADDAIEDMVHEALACEDMEECIQCKESKLKTLFGPQVSPGGDDATETDTTTTAGDGGDDRDYYSTSSDEEEEAGDEESSTTTTTTTTQTEEDAPRGRVCCYCTNDIKVCVKCREELHLRFYDDARAPVCKGCRWRYCFPFPRACWRVRADEITPDGLDDLSLPRVPHGVIADDLTSSVYDVDGDDGEGGLMDSTQDEIIQRYEDSIRVGTNSLLCPGLDPQTATLTSVDERIVGRSRLLQLRKKLLPRRLRIEANYAGDSERLQEEMGRFKEEACIEFWKTIWTCEPRSEFSDVVCKGMAYLQKHTPDRLWPEHNATFRNLSLYGNMRLFYHQNFTRHFRLKEGLMPRALWKLMLVRDSALEYDYGLHVNLLEDGEGSTGKSYNMDCMTDLSFEGSIHRTTHISGQAFNTNEDWNYACIVMHECPLNFLGVDQYGNQVEGSEFIKDRLTSNVCQADRCNWQPSGKTTRSTSFSRCMGNMILATNTNPPPTDTPLMQRFLREVVTKYPGGTYDVADIAEPMGDEMDQQTKNLFVHESRMRHVFIMIVERAIEAGFFHDVNTNLVVMYFKRIFNRLHQKYQIPKTPIRVRHMLLKLCRIACVKAAVFGEFCTELNRWRFCSDGRTFREFEPHSLINLERKLVVTEEMIADVLSLFRDSFIPTLTQKFLAQCQKLSGLNVREKSVPAHRYKKIFTGAGRRDVLDRNYVEFDYGSLSKFYDRIWNMTKGQLTPGIISAKLLGLKKRFIEVDNKNYVRPSAKGAGSGQQQQQQQQPRITIPCAEVIHKPGSRRAQSVCIAIEAMCVKLDEAALSETLKWAFSHASARQRRIITSFVHVDPDGRTYPHMLDTIDVENKPRCVMQTRNHLAITRMDEALVYNRLFSNTYGMRNASMSSDFITVWGEDAETSTFKMHWRTIGAYWQGWNEDRFRPMGRVGAWDLPWVYMDNLWAFRDRQKHDYCTLIEFERYPEDPRALHVARTTASEQLARDMEAGEQGLCNLSSLMDTGKNPEVALGLYSNWGLTYKEFGANMEAKRKMVESFDPPERNPFYQIPASDRIAVVSRNRQQVIEQTNRARRKQKETDRDLSIYSDTEGSFYPDDDDEEETRERPLKRRRKKKHGGNSLPVLRSRAYEKCSNRGGTDELGDLIHHGDEAPLLRNRDKARQRKKTDGGGGAVSERNKRGAKRRRARRDKQRLRLERRAKKGRTGAKIMAQTVYAIHHSKTHDRRARGIEPPEDAIVQRGGRVSFAF